MRVLVLSEKVPHPEGHTSGDHHVFHRIRLLAPQHNFTVAYVNWNHETEPEPSALYPFRMISLPVPPRPAKIPVATGSRGSRRVREWRHALLDRDPYFLTGRRQPELQAALQKLVDDEKPDVIHTLGWLGLCEIPSNARHVVAEVQDMYSRGHWQQGDHLRRITHRMQYWIEGKKIEAVEKRFMRRASLVLVVSPLEQAVARSLSPRTPVAVIRTSADLEYFRPDSTAPEPATLLYTGSMDYPPNAEAVQYFCAEILPRVRRVVPEAQLWIVGRNPPDSVRALASEYVHVTGAVQDVRPFLARSTVCIVPLKHGAGTRIKIVEAWAMKKAIVSTTLGAEGLDAQHMQHLWIADAPDAFAQAIATLIHQPALRERFGENGRRHAEAHFSMATAACQLDAIYRSLAPAA